MSMRVKYVVFQVQGDRTNEGIVKAADAYINPACEELEKLGHQIERISPPVMAESWSGDPPGNTMIVSIEYHRLGTEQEGAIKA